MHRALGGQSQLQTLGAPGVLGPCRSRGLGALPPPAPRAERISPAAGRPGDRHLSEFPDRISIFAPKISLRPLVCRGAGSWNWAITPAGVCPVFAVAPASLDLPTGARGRQQRPQRSIGEGAALGFVLSNHVVGGRVLRISGGQRGQ